MPFLNSNCVSSCHLTNKRQSVAIRLGNAGPENIITLEPRGIFGSNFVHICILTLSSHWYEKR